MANVEQQRVAAERRAEIVKVLEYAKGMAVTTEYVATMMASDRYSTGKTRRKRCWPYSEEQTYRELGKLLRDGVVLKMPFRDLVRDGLGFKVAPSRVVWKLTKDVPKSKRGA